MPEENQNSNNLTSWKQIADFLGVSERTAQTWEVEKGLPVKRLTGSRGRVSADIADLELWMKANIKPAPWYASLKFLRYYGAIATGLLFLALGILVGARLAEDRKGEPADCRLEYRALIVTDSNGRELWRKPFDIPLNLAAYAHPTGTGLWKARFEKLDPGSSEVSVIFPYYPITPDKTGTEFICYSRDGEKKWRFNLAERSPDLSRRYSPTYVIGDYEVMPAVAGGQNWIFATSYHTYGDLNRFVILDGGGNLIGDYWHYGHLPLMEIVDFDGDGVNEIFLGSVNSEHHRAILLILDPRNVNGAFKPLSGAQSQLAEFEQGSELASVLFPRTCINRPFKHNYVSKLSVLPDWIKVDVVEVPEDENNFIIYIFAKNLAPQWPVVSDRLMNLHAAMRSRKELDHDFSEAEVDELAKNIFVNWRSCK